MSALVGLSMTVMYVWMGRRYRALKELHDGDRECLWFFCYPIWAGAGIVFGVTLWRLLP